MAGGFRDKSLEEIKEDVARMNNQTQSDEGQSKKQIEDREVAEAERAFQERKRNKVEEIVPVTNSNYWEKEKLKNKPNNELTEKEILLMILGKLDEMNENIQEINKRESERDEDPNYWDYKSGTGSSNFKLR